MKGAAGKRRGGGHSKLAALLLALSASLAAGVGLALLAGAHLSSHGGSAAITAALPAATGSPAAGSPAGPPQFPLLENALSVPRPGQPSRLVIPSIGLDSAVVPVGTVLENGTLEWDTAAFAVGFYEGTALPGTRGNSVMAGHISSPVSHKGDVFRHLPQVRPGDMLNVFGSGQEWQYRVSEVRIVEPTAISVMDPTSDATLTLLTCYPDGVYTQRFVVVSKLVSDTNVAPNETSAGPG